LELAALAGRFAQFLGASALLGWPLLYLYGFPNRPPPRPVRLVLGIGAILVLGGGLVSLSAQAAAMTGAPEASRDPEAWMAVLGATTYGRGLSARLALALLALGLAIAGPRSRRGWSAAATVAALLVASFAWTGHAAGGEGAEGWVHRIADVLHLQAAAVWLGALPALAWLAARAHRRSSEADVRDAHLGLARFSGIGGFVVAALVLTGLVNSWMLIGVGQIPLLVRSIYGQVLLVKLALFGAMLGLAAANRYALTPRLRLALAGGSGAAAPLRALRLSIAAEIGLGALVLAAVSLLGTLPPPAEALG
jgi:putative copper resistance protein D